MHTTNQIIDFLRNQKDLFRKEFKVKRIGIFGSYARGDIYEKVILILWLNLKNLIYFI